MNGKTGHRRVTPNSLRGELLARGYRGLPEGTSYHDALKLVRRYVRGCSELSQRAKSLMEALLQIQAKTILEVDGQFDLVNDQSNFTVYARNATLEDMLGMSRRTIQKALAELREMLFVWCNDHPSRNRSRSNGINLLPTFARVAELATQTAERQARAETVRFMQMQFTQARIELEGLKSMQVFAHHPALDALLRQCDVLRRSKDTDKGLEKLLFLKQAIDELKALVVLDVDNSKQESPQGDQIDTPITYKLKTLFKNVEAWQKMESGSAVESESDTVEPGATRRPVVLGPDAERMLPVVEAAFRAKDLGTYDTEGRSPKTLLAMYGRSAASLIKLHQSAVTELRSRFGEVGASYILIQAAFDPYVRNRPGWARSFLRDDLPAAIDTRGSFFRWRGTYSELGGAPGAT